MDSRVRCLVLRPGVGRDIQKKTGKWMSSTHETCPPAWFCAVGGSLVEAQSRVQLHWERLAVLTVHEAGTKRKQIESVRTRKPVQRESVKGRDKSRELHCCATKTKQKVEETDWMDEKRHTSGWKGFRPNGERSSAAGASRASQPSADLRFAAHG